jgi:hypothetical protein
MKISNEHRTLLMACTADDRNFESELRKWEQVQDINEIDFATMRLIPYLYKKAKSLNVSMSNEGICRGLYLRAWYMLATVGSPSLEWVREREQFNSAVILKGAAFQATIYGKDPPTRPADDLDLLIPSNAVDAALDTLEVAGLKVDHGLSRQSIRSLRNGTNLYGNHMAIDVHWNLLPVSLDPTFTPRVLSRSVLVHGGLRTLCSTDHLLHTFVHGFARNEILPIRWVLDAALLIREGDIDWDLFWKEVSLTGWHRVVRKQIRFLAQFEVIVPEPVGQKFSSNWFLLISEWIVVSRKLWVRRVLRVLGYDFASWAQNNSRGLSLTNYWLNWPSWVALEFREWEEYKEFRSTRE